MAANRNFLKLYNMMGNCRNLLSSRIILPTYRPLSTMKSTTTDENTELPVAPKKPLTPYFTWVKQIRPSLAAKNPNLKMIELTKVIAQQWKNVDEKLKKKMQEEYLNNLELYKVAKAEHYNAFTDEQKRQLEKVKLEEKHKKEIKLQRKLIKSLGKPKRPGTAFATWVSSLGAKRGTMKLSEWQKSLVPKWEALPAKERAVFESKAAQAMADYLEELKNWEDKMVKIGKHDLVRYGIYINPPPAPRKTESTE